MKPSSFDTCIWLRRAKGSAEQRQKNMYEWNEAFSHDDEGSHAVAGALA